MTFTLDITLILETLLFLLVAGMAAYLLWPSGGTGRRGAPASAESGDGQPAPAPAVVNHYHYVITIQDGKEVAEKEMDSDADGGDGGLYDCVPDPSNATREDIRLLRSLETDTDPESRRAKIDRLVEVGLVTEADREPLMGAVVGVTVDGTDMEGGLSPEPDSPEDGFGAPLPDSGFIDITEGF